MRRGGLLYSTQSLGDASWWSSTPCGITMATGGFRVCRDSRREHVADSHSSPDGKGCTSSPLMARTRLMATPHHAGLEVFLRGRGERKTGYSEHQSFLLWWILLEILVLGTYMKQLSNSVTSLILYILICFPLVSSFNLLKLISCFFTCWL